MGIDDSSDTKGRHVLPQRLSELCNTGWWPSSDTELEADALIPPERVRLIAPDENRLVLQPPPFPTVQDELDSGNAFWSTYGVAHEVDPGAVLIIGDFGAGSDAVVALDYRWAPPTVIRLQWAPEGNHWITIADTFDDFADALGLP